MRWSRSCSLRAVQPGFETVRYTASALVDMAAHALTERSAGSRRVRTRRARAHRRAGRCRHEPPAHALPAPVLGLGYAAGYYVYLWAEVLDADGYEAFVEAGNPFDAAVAARLRRFIYSSGNSIEPSEAYRAFRDERRRWSRC
jgi:peptidyl-dipeptidase Dcp